MNNQTFKWVIILCIGLTWFLISNQLPNKPKGDNSRIYIIVELMFIKVFLEYFMNLEMGMNSWTVPIGKSKVRKRFFIITLIAFVILNISFLNSYLNVINQ